MPIVAERRIHISGDMYLRFIAEINFPTYLAYYKRKCARDSPVDVCARAHGAADETHFRTND